MRVTSPQNLNDSYNDAFRRGSLDEMVSLYEVEATLSPQPGVLLQGGQAIRERLATLLTLKGELTFNNQSCVVAGDIALLFADWQFVAESPTGQPVKLGGRSSKVARRQADGCWKYVLDLPLGT